MVAVGICHLCTRDSAATTGPWPRRGRPGEQAPELYTSMGALAELIEAACRTGQTRLAAGALTGLPEATSVGQTDRGRESTPAAGPCSATARTPRPVIARQSVG